METVDRASPVPIYQQIKRILLEELRVARHEPGKPFLTEEELIRRFHVSRAPIRQALKELAHEGYVYRERAKGTYPVPGGIRNASHRLGGLVEYLRGQGLIAQSRVSDVERVRPPERVRAILGFAPEAEVFTMGRLISIEGEPLVFVRSYLDVPSEFAPTTADLEEAGTVFVLLERDFGFTCPRGELQIWASAASAEDAAAVSVPEGDPILITETTMYARDGRVAGWSRSVHPADRYKYMFVVTR